MPSPRAAATRFSASTLDPETRTWTEGDNPTIEIARGERLLRLDSDMFFDLESLRYRTAAVEAIRQFAPDVVRITGPGDCGPRRHCASAIEDPDGSQLAQGPPQIRGPSPAAVARISARLHQEALAATLQFYKMAKVILAPSPDLVEMLLEGTGKPCFLMRRGIDYHHVQSVAPDAARE